MPGGRPGARDLTQRLRRPPTVTEIGALASLTQSEVREAIEAATVYEVASLDAPVSKSPNAAERQEVMGSEDAALSTVCDRLALRRLVAELPERDRQILTRYYFGDATQEQIAADFGMSQMNVSRILRDVVRRLRDDLEGRTERPDHRGDRGPKPGHHRRHGARPGRARGAA